MIYNADKNVTDGTAYNFLNRVDSEIPFVLVSWVDDFQFNTDLNFVNNYYLVDFVEYGWDWDMKPHRFGIGQETERFKGEQWKKFDDFVKNNPPLKYFKREIFKEQVDLGLIPIDYPCWFKVSETQTREEFNNRAFEVINTWGRSHEDRLRLHAEIWQKASKYGYNVCDNLNSLNGFADHEVGKKWITANIPWYARFPIEMIVGINGHAKISISKAGAGRKCFRHTESPINSVMLMIDDGIQFGYEWVHDYNCIMCKEGEEIETIIKYLESDKLYDIYVNGVETCRKYELETYITNYIKPKLNAIIL